MPQEKLTEKQIQEWRDKIGQMTHLEMGRLWRYSPAGHPVFRTDLPLYKWFKKRFDSLGGMTPSISKALGW